MFPGGEETALERKNLKDGLNLIVDELVRQGISLEQARNEFEKQFIAASLRSNRGNVCRSARSLGVHRNTLRNKVSALGITSDEVGPSPRIRRPLS